MEITVVHNLKVFDLAVHTDNSRFADGNEHLLGRVPHFDRIMAVRDFGFDVLLVDHRWVVGSNEEALGGVLTDWAVEVSAV
jgi:hypothetical protein